MSINFSSQKDLISILSFSISVFPKYFQKVFLKTAIPPYPQVLSENDIMEPEKSEFISVCLPAPCWAQSTGCAKSLSSSFGLAGGGSSLRAPETVETLQLLGKRQPHGSWELRQKLSRSLDFFFFLCLIRNRLSLPSSSAWLCLFLCLPCLPSLGSLSSLGLW